MVFNKVKKIVFIKVLITISFINGQNKKADVSVSIIKNYKNWKWDKIFVAKNKFISVAIVPDAAGFKLSLKNQICVIFFPGRVHNRSRSPRLAASSY